MNSPTAGQALPGPPSGPAPEPPGAARECGAFGRAVLSQDLRDLGFEINALTGPVGRCFDVAGVPEGLMNVGRPAAKGCAGSGREGAA